MVTFLSIFLILLLVNGVLLVFSANGSTEKIGPTAKDATKSSNAKIYPIDLLSSKSKYKKAI